MNSFISKQDIKMLDSCKDLADMMIVWAVDQVQESFSVSLYHNSLALLPVAKEVVKRRADRATEESADEGPGTSISGSTIVLLQKDLTTKGHNTKHYGTCQYHSNCVE